MLKNEKRTGKDRNAKKVRFLIEDSIDEKQNSPDIADKS